MRARGGRLSQWDNHEFSWLGWQGMQRFDGKNRPAQTRKVAANQAFFEYQPARLGRRLETFDPPQVADAPVTRFDDHGLGQEPNNLIAMNSLRGYRALRWGRNVELIVTDQRSYRSEEPSVVPEAAPLASADFPEFMAEEALEILDGGRAYAGGHPPASIRFGSIAIENSRRTVRRRRFSARNRRPGFWIVSRRSQANWKIGARPLRRLKSRGPAISFEGDHRDVARCRLCRLRRESTARRTWNGGEIYV